MNRSFFCGSLLFFVMTFILVLAGCGRTPDHAAKPAASGQRIVCLSPAITQMLLDMGLKDQLVGGISADPVRPADVAVVGDLYEPDLEKLLNVHPTMLLIQPPARGVSERLTSMCKQNGWQLHTWKIENIADVMKVLLGDADSPGLGEIVGRESQARALAEKFDRQCSQLKAATAGLDHPRALMLFGTNPLTAVGPGTVLDEMLTMAGGVNVLADAKTSYPVLDREDVLKFQPQVVIIIQGEKVGVTGPIEAPTALASLDIPAVTDHRVVQLTDPVALLPSTSAPRVAVEVAKLLHPSHAEAFEHILSGDGQQ